jgi:hypothetical protein
LRQASRELSVVGQTVVSFAIGTGSLTNWWEDEYQVPVFDPARFLDWRHEIEKVGPPILWTAEPMASHYTGMRPEGESVKLHGVWWKIEPWTSMSIARHFAARNAFEAMMSDGWMVTASYPLNSPFAFAPHAEDAHKALIKAVDDAFRSGMTREQVILLIDCRNVIQVMED